MRAVDLVGHVTETQRFWVVELKIAPKPQPEATSRQSRYGETPLRALYEALIYAAVIEANTDHIATELQAQRRKVEHPRPGLLITAPTDYWERWDTKSSNRRLVDAICHSHHCTV